MPEIRKTSSTGGQKGQKPNRQDLIAVPFLEQLGLVCGMGAEKYDDDNWRKGYSWRLSYGAMQRHIHAFWTGEDNDPESGLPHLAHAAWHCMVLFTYSSQSKYAEHDDRPDLPENAFLDQEVIERLRAYYGVSDYQPGDVFSGRITPS